MGTTKIFFLLSFFNVVMAAFLVFELGGVGGDTSTEEDMELERQLKFLNKPARKSFQDLDGSIYDCVDIDKQPALDHPLLKNNKIQMEPPSPPKELAVVSTANGSYHGASGMMNIFNPFVKPNQFSEAIIRVQHRSPETSSVNYIQAGWAVNPMLFKDNQSRLFSYWTADEYRKTGCFNSLCPGFVQVETLLLAMLILLN
ncbi:hypothetical protein CK203_072266 [Vitis vinifera]|uniref:Neprosin PEP catalytic domain-containing protein n=1 Tax=Vitis vinifera TaxID=29760 RepID=A0A438BVA3_VITVI|nr:hypothetical protein CK203_072266 [Vitis vinifera]